MIPPSYVRVLDAIMRLHQQRRHITIRSIAGELDWHSNHYVHLALKLLRIRGLIAYEDRNGGTIRPLVKFIPVERLP